MTNNLRLLHFPPLIASCLRSGRSFLSSFLWSFLALLSASVLIPAVSISFRWLPSAQAAPPVESREHVLSGSNSQAALKLPVATLRNIDYMPRLHTLQPPARPHKILRWHHEQVQLAQDQKILRLLLVSVGIAGIFIAILVMRSMPPGKKGSGAA